MTHPLTNALAMRTAAAAVASPYTADCECSQCVRDFMISQDILALPLEADRAALLREAVNLPEVAALLAFATHVSDGDSADYTDNWKTALAALQPFLALETP